MGLTMNLTIISLPWGLLWGYASKSDGAENTVIVVLFVRKELPNIASKPCNLSDILSEIETNPDVSANPLNEILRSRLFGEFVPHV